MQPDHASSGGPAPDTDRWRQIEELFDAALDLPPAARQDFLDQRTGGDIELRREVERLLNFCDPADDFLAEPASEFAASLLAQAESAEREQPGFMPSRIGPYRTIREVGRGGMGAVYLGERDDAQFRMRAALKVLPRGTETDEAIRRFREERQILASLEHPHIARLLDGGITDEGLPWFAMEYVEGQPIDRFCDERELGVEARLELFCTVCEAVQYAHRNLVVHRDLKPSNILVTQEGEPKLLDFGIAKLLSQSAEAGLTRAGVRLLTPEYASPEQLLGDPVSTASDVYSLGVLLYELLTRYPPHRRGTRSTRELEQRVLEREPERPSLAVLRAEPPDQVSRTRGMTAAKLSRRLRGDLDTIVLKAMHKEPQRRYATAEQLAEDVRRHLNGLPVSARPDTTTYRVRKFVRRNRWGVAAVAAAVLLLLGFSGVTAVQAARIREDARRIAAERDRAQQGEAFLLGLFGRSDPYQGSGNALTVQEMLGNGAAKLSQEMADRPETRARMFLAIGRAYYGLGENEQAIALMDSSYALLRALHGETDPDAIGAANQLANVLRVAGRYDAATELYQRILQARRQQYGDRTPEVARALNGLALVLWMQGRSDEAETLLREALVTDRKHAPDEPAHLAQTLNNLGHVMRDQGDLAAAEALHRESLSVRRALWGPEHFEVSVSLSNLAGVLRDRGDYAGADTLYRQALDLRSRLVGGNHPDLAYDRAGFARLLHHRGELRASEALYLQALGVQRQALPAGHPLTAVTLTGLGHLLLDINRPEEARPLLEEALTTRRRILVPGHWQIAEAESTLGACLLALGRTDEAEPLLMRGHAALKAEMGEQHPATRRAQQYLTDYLERQAKLNRSAGASRNV